MTSLVQKIGNLLPQKELSTKLEAMAARLE